MSRIHVSIDRLVLAGLDRSERSAFVASFKAELGRMLADPAIRSSWARSHKTPSLRVNGGAFDASCAGARKLGVKVASGIGKGLKP